MSAFSLLLILMGAGFAFLLFALAVNLLRKLLQWMYRG